MQGSRSCLGICLIVFSSCVASVAIGAETNKYPFEAVFRCETSNIANPDWQERVTIKWDVNSSTNPQRILWSGPQTGSMLIDDYVRPVAQGELLLDRPGFHVSLRVFLMQYAPAFLHGFYFNSGKDQLTAFQIHPKNGYTSHGTSGSGEFVSMDGECELIKGEGWERIK